MSAVCLPSVPCHEKADKRTQNHVKRTKKRQKITGHNFHRQSRLQLLLTGASRQLDVWDFRPSAANGCQQRHFLTHSHSSQPQLSLRPQRGQVGHSPTPQSPASHAEHIKLCEACFFVLLHLSSNCFCRLR